MALKYEESLSRVQDPRELEYRINEYGMKDTAKHYGISYHSLEKIVKHYGVKQDKMKLNKKKSAGLVSWFDYNRRKRG